MADSAIQDMTLNLGHPVIPLLINYGLASSLPGMLSRLAIQRQGYSASHMDKYGSIELKIAFLVPLGGDAATVSNAVEHKADKVQFEDLRVLLSRLDGKVPDALADLIDLKTASEFNCTSCYAVGEHRDSCKYDCPQA